MRDAFDRPILGSTLAGLIGGRWAVSLLAYVINAPLNLVAISSNAGASAPGASWLQWLVVSVVGYLGFGGVLFVADQTAFRNRGVTPVRVVSVIELGALAGGVRGLIVGGLAAVWGLTQESLVLVMTRAFTGALLGAVLLPFAAFILAAIDAYRTQRADLLREHRRLRVQAMRDEGTSSDLEQALLASVRQDLAEVQRTGDAALARDVSHRLWEDVPDELAEPRVPWTSVLRASVQRNPFATVPVIVIWVLSSVGTLTAAIGWQRAVLQVLWSVAVIAVTFGFGRGFVRRLGHPIAAFVVTMLLAVVLTGPVASVMFDPRPWPAGASLVLANSLWLPILALAVGFVVAALQSSEDVLDDLRAMVDDDAIAALASHDERERLRRELATRLHGTVQSRLLAAQAVARDGVLAEEAVRGLVSLGERSSVRALGERMRDLVRPWASLLAVSVDVDEGLDPGFDDAIVRIVEDALTNAFRHGQAMRVEVAVVADERGCVVSVVDDGVGVPADARPGMGSAVLDSLASEAWTRVSDGVLTRLTVRLLPAPGLTERG